MTAENSTKRASTKRTSHSDISPLSKRAKRVSTSKSTYKEPSSSDEDAPAKVTIKKSITKSHTTVKPTQTASSSLTAKIAKSVTAKVGDVRVAAAAAEPNPTTATNTAKHTRKPNTARDMGAMPLAARTVGARIVVGAHVSAAGGAHKAAVNSVHVGGNAFALFLKSQRKWAFAPLQEEQVDQFVASCELYGYGHAARETEKKDGVAPIVPHGSYLVNLAHTEASRAKQAYESFVDDLDRCRRLGIRLYNFHPGNAIGAEDRMGAIRQLAKQLNQAHKDPSSGKVITLLETMAAVDGNTIGGTFEELAQIIELVEQKDRIGVCLDTCHVFAAGYDLRTPEAFQKTMTSFDSSIGLQYLKALHMNDSKAPLASGRDLHANIGTGFLGLLAFRNIVNEQRLWGLPMILETPIDRKDPATGKNFEDKAVWAREIKLLESLVGMDVEGEEFKTLERDLSEFGKAERERVQDQVSRRANKGKKKEKGKKQVATSDEESGGD